MTGLDTGNPLVEMAEQILDEITRSVLAEGWEYNTEREYPFTPTLLASSSSPSNVLSLDDRPG